jgi:cbb3-type cytochrome oxidase maturation protein
MMIPIALIFAGAFVGAFVWAAKSGQFDDVETPAHRMLNEDETKSSGRKEK